MDPAVLRQAASFTVAGIAGMKDFSPLLAATGLAACPLFAGKRVNKGSMDSPLPLGNRDYTTLDLARFLDKAEGSAWLLRTLPKAAAGAEAVFLPAVLGTAFSAALHADLPQKLGFPVLELFCPVPSVTGLRLRAVLHQALKQRRVSMVEGTTATGAIVEQGRCAALVTEESGRQRIWRARNFIMATGGFFGKGIESGPGRAREAVFGLPVSAPEEQYSWSDQCFLSRNGHLFARLGVATDASLRPVDPAGDPVLENVFFVGRSLRGYDHALEKSGNGVALATGYAAGMTV
jgi:glycerol-3-phosphate dehydrogenase subunit B